jgi:hypothetical protein
MAIYERGETYVHQIKFWDSTKTPANPSIVSFYLYDPCSHTIVNNQLMTNDAVGSYHYYYTLSSTATYGRYTAKVRATSAAGYIEDTKTEFFIMPWDVVPEIRDTMGILEQKSVTDDVIARMVWSSYLYALHDLYTHVHNEYPDGNVDTGAGFDGTNTAFHTKQYPLADINGDGTVTGSNTSCATDISGWWRDIDGHYQTAKIVVTQAEYGEITVFQNDGITAIPSTNNGVYIDYWVRPEFYSMDIFRSAVVRLTCYELSKRLQSLDQITLADIKNNNPVITIDPYMYMREYKRYLHITRGPSSGGVDL